jgi:ribosome-associated translation inhibitor RaiA
MNELDFTLEMNSEELDQRLENEMFAKADDFLRSLAGESNDLRGAAINIRRPAKTESAFIYEVTVAVYARPNQIAATQKEADPMIALVKALTAVERQVREKREKLSQHWKQPGQNPVEQEVLEVMAADTDEE